MGNPPSSIAGGGAPTIVVEGLTRRYRQGEHAVTALDGVSFAVQPGEFVAVMGPSGSGKSTLLNLLGLLDTPTAGTYLLEGRDVSTLGGGDRALVRRARVGFVFQSFNLLPRATALQNVALPLVYAGVSPAERKRRATAALERVGLANRADHRPNELSGGEQQRVAIARALINGPAVVLADEPTGNLDSAASGRILDLIERANGEGVTVIMVTHERDVALRARRWLLLRDGRIVSDEPSPRGARPDRSEAR